MRFVWNGINNSLKVSTSLKSFKQQNLLFEFNNIMDRLCVPLRFLYELSDK